MRTPLAALTAALLTVASPWALAASNIDLTVKGLITPSACTPNLSSGGIVEVGKIAVSDIHQDNMTYLPTAPIDLRVNCTAPTLFAVAPHDNRPQMHTPWAFGFTKMAPDLPIGGYWLEVSDFITDDTPLTRLYSENNGQSWLVAPDRNYYIEPRQLTAFGEKISGPPQVLPVQNLMVSLWVNPFLYPAKTWLPANQEVPIDGSTTLEVRYL